MFAEYAEEDYVFKNPDGTEYISTPAVDVAPTMLVACFMAVLAPLVVEIVFTVFLA